MKTAQKNPLWKRVIDMYHNSNTTKGEARQQVVKLLREDLEIIPVRDTGDLLWYDPNTGIYRKDAESKVRELLEAKLGPLNTKSEANKIIYKLSTQSKEDPSAFKASEMICLENGILDLSRGDPKLLSHDPSHRFLRYYPVKYDPQARYPRFKQAINDWVVEDDIAKLQEFAGYTLIQPNENPFQKALMIVGPTASGKSTFLNVLTALLGGENVSNLALQQITDDKFALAQLRGKVANICNDLDADIVRNIGLFKQMASADKVEVDRKYKDHVSFRVTQKQIYGTNRVPEIDYDDDAFYRRWLHVRFPNTIPETERDKSLEAKLTEELPGILNWAIDGYIRLMRNDGFADELPVEEKRVFWMEYGHSIDRFIQAKGERVSGSELPKDMVYAAYEAFCDENNLPVEQKQTFSKRLKRKYDITTSRPKLNGERVRCYQGLLLPDDEHGEADASEESSEWMRATTAETNTD